jgi:MFS transporter, MHS family, proline/betaine transporter
MISTQYGIIAAGVIGNVLEWYDFAIYAYFAAAIGRQFFPHQDAVAQLLSAFGVFALGYLMRPIGGALVGHIGDQFGRRAALTFSVTAMAIPTFLIGLLPGYATLGLWAPTALTLLRMVQGLSVGGEYTSSMVFLVEHAPEGRRGLMGALAASGATGGILLGSGVGAAFAATLSATALESWGWRIPFLLGLVVGIAGYFLRRHLLETTPTERRRRLPIIVTLHDHLRPVLCFAGLSVFGAAGFYASFVYLVSWLQTADRIPASRALEINSFSMAMLLPTVIAAGLLSDRFGRKPLLLLSTLLGLVGALPLFWLLNHPSTIIGIYLGTLPVVVVEAAPPSLRCTTVSRGYNISYGVIGGLTPLVATWLVTRTGDEIAPAFLMIASAAVTLIATVSLRETYRASFTAVASGAAPTYS